jgi:multidrug efflux system outer membrane protein
MSVSRHLLPPLLALLSACAVGQRYTPPAVSVPEAWTETSAMNTASPPESLERWWTEFRDPLLDDLIARAIAGNIDLKIASARIREARAARGIAASAALPQVDAAAAYGRLRRSDEVPPFNAVSDRESPFGARDQNLFEAGFDAAWEIDVFGGVRHDKEAAVAQVQATEEARRDVLVSLMADVARNYIELRATQQRLAILDDTLRSQEDTLGLVRARATAGLATDLDVARAEAILATTGSGRPVLRREAGETTHRLGVLLGTDPLALAAELAVPGALPPLPLGIPPSLPSELLARRPDLRRAERDVAAAGARLGVARADLFPRFSILGNFGRRSDDLGNLGALSSQFWSFIPGVRWPLLSGGRVRANIRVQDARLEQAARQYEQQVLTALNEVADALLAHARARERQTPLDVAVAANRRAVGLALDRYTSGLDTYLAVLDAQRSAYAAEDALVQNQRAIAVALITVYKALGGGWAVERQDTLQKIQ